MTGWKRWTMVAVILGSGIVFLDTSVVNLALPEIGKSLDSALFDRLEAQSYIVNGYFLTLSALLILAGALTDQRGRRRMFGIGLGGFLVTSVLCGVAVNMEMLIVCRILQGAAGALVVPGSLAIITSSFEGEEQGRAFGVWAGASAATTILGPVVGGLLVNYVSWRAVFFINVPFLLLAWWATLRHVPESRDEDAPRRLDWIGTLVIVLAVGGLAFGTIRGQATDWKGSEAFVSLAVGAIAAVAFPILMVRSAHPLVPPSLFRSRNFTVTNIATFVIYGALYVTLTFQYLFMIGTLGYNEQAAGAAGIPGTLFLVLFSTRFGKLAARYGPRRFMTIGPAIMALGLLWFVRMPATSEPWVLGTGSGAQLFPPADYAIDVLPAILVFGLGLMVMVSPLVTALMTSVPRQNSGVASAVNNAISRVGAPLVTAVIFVAVVSSFYNTIGAKVPGVDTSSSDFRQQVAPLNPPEEGVSPEITAAAREASTDSFHLAMLVAAGLMAVGAVVNGVGIRDRQALEAAEAEARAGEETPEGEAAPVREVPPAAAPAGAPGAPVVVQAEAEGAGDPRDPPADPL
ncbi:MAG: MFS transporter [Actinobacteria bacterium]|nr:MFS transporter [Actinomycetota bacterium]